MRLFYFTYIYIHTYIHTYIIGFDIQCRYNQLLTELITRRYHTSQSRKLILIVFHEMFNILKMFRIKVVELSTFSIIRHVLTFCTIAIFRNLIKFSLDFLQGEIYN